MNKEQAILSFGGGQDSSAILFRLLNDKKAWDELVVGDLWVIMSDTGNEHPETYAWVEKVQALCLQRGIRFWFIKPEMGFHTPAWQSLTHQWTRSGSVGMKRGKKSCTDKLKITPIYHLVESLLGGSRATKKGMMLKYAEKFGKIRVLIGIAAGEEKRAAGASNGQRFMQKAVERVYPLITWGWDRAKCQAYLKEIAGEIPPPSNCMFCPFVSEHELLWLHRFYPAKFEEWVCHEARKLQKHVNAKENLGVFGKRDLRQVLADAQAKYGHMTNEELTTYKMSHGHCTKTKY